MSDLKNNLTGNEFCLYCKNKGYYYVPDSECREEFDRIYDKIDQNSPASDITYDLAIKEVSSHIEYCDRCEKGIDLSKKNKK